MSDTHSRESPTEKFGRKHLFDVEMAPNPEYTYGRTTSGIAANVSGSSDGMLDETTSENGKEEPSAIGNTSVSILGTPFLVHQTVHPSPSPSPHPNTITSSETPRKPRKRKLKTKEMGPPELDGSTDSSIPHIINLGMSPFMPGQDAMSNQNRLVRNEVILARHVSRILRSQTDSESTHARRLEDVYRMLGDQKADIESLRVSVNTLMGHGQRQDSVGDMNRKEMTEVPERQAGAYSSHPEIIELRKEQKETRMILAELNDDVTRFSTSTRRMIDDLTEAIQRLGTHDGQTSTSGSSISGGPPISGLSSGSSVASSIHLLPSEGSLTAFIANRTLPPIGALNPQRLRNDSTPFSSSPSGSGSSFSGQTSTLPTFSNGPENAYLAMIGESNFASSRANVLNLIPTVNNPAREVLYGPLSNVGNININAIVNDALQNVGLSTGMVHSVRRAHNRPDHVVICFHMVEHAHRFVDLIGLGLDKYPDRQAVLAAGN